MNCQIFDLQYDRLTEMETEIRFDVAIARTGGAEIVRFNVDGKGDVAMLKKRSNFLLKTLRQMKKSGTVQFFATEEDFTNMSMEADFMYNKYAEHIKVEKREKDISTFVYVKI